MENENDPEKSKVEVGSNWTLTRLIQKIEDFKVGKECFRYLYDEFAATLAKVASTPIRNVRYLNHEGFYLVI